MFEAHVFTAVALMAVVVSPPVSEASSPCQMDNQADYVAGQCSVKISLKPADGGRLLSDGVFVHVWGGTNATSRRSKIEVKVQMSTVFKGKVYKGVNGTKWLTLQNFIKAEAGKLVSVSLLPALCSVSCTMPDPVPEFHLSVNQSSKSVTVTVETEHKVNVRWCYLKNPVHCDDGLKIKIDPSSSRSADLPLPYLLPCVCVQVYYTHIDARRHHQCPFKGKSLADPRDVWLTSKVTAYKSHLSWGSLCPASDLNVSASLCWRQRDHVCTPVLNVTLERTETGNLKYNTSAVDKHPRMCVQFSLQGSFNISCPFQSEKPSWDVKTGPGRQSLILYLTSSVQARFSAQLCILNEGGCTARGQIHSSTIEGNATETSINVPLDFVAETLCVQVWQSDVSLFGRRILCPDYTHNRRGLYAVAALMFVIVVALIGIFIHRLTKRGATGWFCVQKPVLLVCSSEQSVHVSAVCALASMLQGELSATVSMALWAQSSQTQVGVPDLGPLPWLYGQWEAVRKAQGKMLIVWSSEAKKTYDIWREERADTGQTDGKGGEKIKEVEEGFKHYGIKMRKSKEKTSLKGGGLGLCDDTDVSSQSREPSTVIAPVFKASLACLEAALQGCKAQGQGVALVYFEGFCHSRDIPKTLRGVSRYCLPQDFRGLIQELGGIRRQTKANKFRWLCWRTLLSKILSLWLARRLTRRLQKLLPQKQTQRPSVASSFKTKSDQTQGELRLPLAAHMAKQDGLHEHEPLNGTAWRAETL